MYGSEKNDDYCSLERQVTEAFPTVEIDGEMVQVEQPSRNAVWRYRKITRYLIDQAERTGDIGIVSDLYDIASGKKKGPITLEARLAIQEELDFNRAIWGSSQSDLLSTPEFRNGQDGSKRTLWSHPLQADDEHTLDIRD